jgi:hypothetical protein
MSSSDQNHALSLYLVSYQEFDDDEYDSFLVVACSEQEAARLTPNSRMNQYLGAGMGYESSVTYEDISYYRHKCGRGQYITCLGEARDNLKWGDVPISSYNAG